MKDSDEHYRKLERLYHGARINEFYRPKLTVSEGAAELLIAVRDEFMHAAHAVHGSVYFKALDDAAFFAVNSVVLDVFVLTASFNVYLTRPISDGTMRAAGRLVHKSKNLFIAEAELFDGEGRQIGRGSGTFMRSGIVLGPDVGYV